MVLKYNGTEVEDVKYNGTPLDFVKYNGTVVWQRYKPGTVLFEKWEYGTYTYTIPVTTSYRIYAVGPGGGSGILSFSKKNHTSQGQNAANVAAGGSGGYVAGTFNLTAGDTITVVVGQLGSNSVKWTLSDGTYTQTGNTGGTTTVKSSKLGKTILTAYGGKGGSVTQKFSSSLTDAATISGGAGGSCTYTGSPSNIANANGYAGKTDNKKGTGSVSAIVTQTNAPYSSYGKGSGGTSTASDSAAGYQQNYNGSDGYVKIEIV